MTSLAFALIVFSGVMHAIWNLLVKRSRQKTIFIWWMFVSSGTLFTISLPFLPGGFPPLDTRMLLLGAAGAFCFVLYHLFTGRAYRGGDLSMVYPLSQTAMVYVPVWGMLMLGERLSLTGACGIAMVIVGAYAVQLRRLSLADLLKPFANLGNSSVQAALAAGFIYSFGAVVDKASVNWYSPLYFTYILVIFMLVFMTINLMRPRYRSGIMEEWRNSRGLILISGPVMMASFLSFRFGLKHAPMSYAVPVRQVSILVGVMIGVLFLGEECGKIRFVAALLILAGVFLIRMG